jgi:hypothetical protein
VRRHYVYDSAAPFNRHEHISFTVRHRAPLRVWVLTNRFDCGGSIESFEVTVSRAGQPNGPFAVALGPCDPGVPDEQEVLVDPGEYVLHIYLLNWSNGIRDVEMRRPR